MVHILAQLALSENGCLACLDTAPGFSTIPQLFPDGLATSVIAGVWQVVRWACVVTTAKNYPLLLGNKEYMVLHSASKLLGNIPAQNGK